MPYPMTIPQYSMSPTMMAGGGPTSTLQDAQSQGRYGDSMLVHMSPQEVGGLQTLARLNGTSMTVNPNTGMPEAFRLQNLIPALAGAALTVGSGGTLNPMTIGLMTGGLGTLATGSLRKGLTMGLGAAGGAGLAGSMAGLGAAAPSTAGTVPPTELLRPDTFAGKAIPNYVPADVAVDQAIAGAQQAAPIITPPTYGEQVLTGAKQAFSSPSSAMTFAGQNKANLAMTASPLMEPEEPQVAGSNAMIRPYTYNYENLSGAPISESGVEAQRFRGTFIEEEPYAAAQGGLMSYAKGGRTVRKKISRDDPFYIFGEDMSKIAEEQFAKGGISSLGPRFLSGGGDGMSDDIPAVIADKQPARLADGEFVIPADVVSHLGNGSSKAGAKKLYAMMDRVRHARTGKKRQAPEVNMNRIMPA